MQTAIKDAEINLEEFPPITESTVGITHTITDQNHKAVPISAVIKNKYEDFLVTEIDETGKIVELTEDTEDENKQIDSAEPEDTAKTLLEEAVGAEVATRFFTWYKAKDSAKDSAKSNDQNDQNDENDKDDGDEHGDKSLKSSKSMKSFTFQAQKDKALRTQIHVALSNLEYLERTTDDSGRVITRRSRFRNQRNRGNKIYKMALGKVGWSTSAAISRLDSALQRNRLKFGFAGNKDKHAVTTQWLTVRGNFNLHAFKGAVDNIGGIKVGSVHKVDELLRLGQLKGNRFQIVLRDVKAMGGSSSSSSSSSVNTVNSKEELDSRLEVLRQRGFVNYFGMQRFGCSSVGTHDIGRAVFQKKYDVACALMMLPRGGDTGHWNQDRVSWTESGDIYSIPRHLYIEKKVMFNLRNAFRPNFEAALQRLDRGSRMLYPHAYQSWIWNQCATHRIEKCGYEPVVGDLVKIQRDEDEDKNGEDAVEFVTEQNIKQYTIYDVVFPLIGPGVKFPKLKTSEFAEDLVKKDGMEMDSICGQDSDWAKNWGLGGGYRAILAKPSNVTGKRVQYEADSQLLVSYEALGVKADEETSGDKVAWVLTFDLEKSCYATVAVRQLLAATPVSRSEAKAEKNRPEHRDAESKN